MPLQLYLLAVIAVASQALAQPVPGRDEPSPEPAIVVLGDSLSSGYGLGGAPSWVAMLQERLRTEGHGYRVVNASIAGDTTAGGLQRLSLMLRRHSPVVVIVELGGNDGLRGQPLEATRENLDAIVQRAQRAGAAVVLAGMQLPPNFGTAYTHALAAIYPELAKQYDVALVPFLLEGVAFRPELMQRDRIHPNAAAQELLLDNVWPVLEPLLRR